MVLPKALTGHFRKIQDTNPTHPCILSQKLATKCLQIDSTTGFVAKKRMEMNELREALLVGCELEAKGTAPPDGAYYFLVPIPENVSEDEAVDILARQFHLLLLQGSIFGAPHRLRLSYGGLRAPSTSPEALDRIEEIKYNFRKGFDYLRDLSTARDRESCQAIGQ